jgi:hypothetical protein
LEQVVRIASAVGPVPVFGELNVDS